MPNTPIHFLIVLFVICFYAMVGAGGLCKQETNKFWKSIHFGVFVMSLVGFGVMIMGVMIMFILSQVLHVPLFRD